MSVIKGTDPNKNQTNAQERRIILTNKCRSKKKAKQQNRKSKKRLKTFRSHIKSIKNATSYHSEVRKSQIWEIKYTHTCTNSEQIKSELREVYLDAMLKAVKLPASISDLNTGLTNVDRNALSHFRFEGISTTKKLKKKLTEALTVRRRRLSRRLLIWVKKPFRFKYD